jgi:hypothetical protein
VRLPPWRGKVGMGGDAGPLGSAAAHPHPTLPIEGGGTSAALDDNIGAEQYWLYGLARLYLQVQPRSSSRGAWRRHIACYHVH